MPCFAPRRRPVCRGVGCSPRISASSVAQLCSIQSTGGSRYIRLQCTSLLQRKILTNSLLIDLPSQLSGGDLDGKFGPIHEPLAGLMTLQATFITSFTTTRYGLSRPPNLRITQSNRRLTSARSLLDDTLPTSSLILCRTMR